MQIQVIEYFDGNQKLIGTLIDNKPCGELNQNPAIIVFHALEGRNDFVMEYGKKIAAQGYTVFVADIYGDGRIATTLEGGFELIGPFLQDRSMVRRRAVLAYETLLQQNHIAKANIGAVGFCFGGMCVLELARSGVSLKAGVSMHGVLAKSDLPTHMIKSHLLVLHGYQDPQVPPSNLEIFGQEMEAAGCPDWSFIFFSHAKHSFTDPHTGMMNSAREKEMGREYNQVAAERSFRYALDFFNESLR